MAILLVFIVSVFNNLQLKHQIEYHIPIGSSVSMVQSTMSSLGFTCVRDSPKALDAPVDELFCSEKEAIGPGLTNKYWRALVAVFPSLHTFAPKSMAGSSPYRRQEIAFVLEDDVVRSIQAVSRLTPQ
jgi:hypothetical protein